MSLPLVSILRSGILLALWLLPGAAAAQPAVSLLWQNGQSVTTVEAGDVLTLDVYVDSQSVGLRMMDLVLAYDSDELLAQGPVLCPPGGSCVSTLDSYLPGGPPVVSNIGPASTVSGLSATVSGACTTASNQVHLGSIDFMVSDPPAASALVTLQYTGPEGVFDCSFDRFTPPATAIAATQCGDGVDNDGDGLTDLADTGDCPTPEDPLEGIGVVSEQKISDTSGGLATALDDSDEFGTSIAAIGDHDGDGTPDIAVGVPLDDDGAVDAGAVFILFLNPDGTVKFEQKISATAGGFAGGLDTDDRFGSQIASMGDLDGDGVQELAVGASKDDDGATNAGALYILFLNPDGTVKSQQKISNLSGGLGPILAAEDEFGNAPTSLGDLDGDGVEDLAVGAYLDNDSGGNSGSVFILFLRQDGTVRRSQQITENVGGFTGPLAVSDRFGATLANLGDLDGDGTLELAVGARFDDGDGSNGGAVWILSMNPDGMVAAELKISSGLNGFVGPLQDLDRFSVPARLGDLDGDGVGDLAVGAFTADDGGADAGVVWVFSLNSDGTVARELKIGSGLAGFGSLDSGDLFGAGLVSPGDVDGDGKNDLVSGAPRDDDGGTDRGAVYVLFLDANPAVCGDSVLGPGESCDDGNTIPGDLCSASCQVEPPTAFVAEFTLEFDWPGGLPPIQIDNLPLDPVDPASVQVGLVGTDIQYVRVSGGLAGTLTGTQTVTAVLGSGTLFRRPGMGFGGTLPVMGHHVPATPLVSSLPFQGSNGTLGVGGTVTISGVQAGFGPWQTSVASLFSGTIGSFGTVMTSGSILGPASQSSTAGQISGVLSLVSPVQLSSGFAGAAYITRLTIRLVPEPGTLVGLLVGAALLVRLGVSRRSARQRSVG